MTKPKGRNPGNVDSSENGPRPVESAQDILFRLSLLDDAPFQEPADVVADFHTWAERKGIVITEQELGDLHVRSILPLDERIAELVIQWAREVYPHIFD